MMNKNFEMNDMELNTVIGGTFTPNKYTKYSYTSHGITVKYHTFEADEFWLPNGTKTGVDGANAYMDVVCQDCDYCRRNSRW